MEPMILVLDDEENIQKDLEKHLEKANFKVYTAGTIERAHEIIKIKNLNYAIIDLKIDYQDDYGGIKIIEDINKHQPWTQILVLSAYELNSELGNILSQVDYSEFVWKGDPNNYIKTAIIKLNRLMSTAPQKKCFVIMPFSSTNSCNEDQWTDIYENLIKPAIEESGFNYECSRSNLDIGNIIEDILDNLNRADVVIADLTDRNPNVYYELGVRHALRNATVLITQNMDDVPFDLQHYATLKYDHTTKNGRMEFKQKVWSILDEIEKDIDGKKVMSPVRNYLKLQDI